MKINLTPTMTPLLVDAGVFADDPFNLIDIGARGGVKDYVKVFGEHLRVVAFEADPEALRQLERQGVSQTTILPFGLGGRNETRTLYINRNASSSSLYVGDPAFVQRMLLRQWYVTIEEQPIELRRLDDLADVVGDVDFIDLDAEGAELEIMQAGATILGRRGTLGVLLEVRFIEGYNTPLFWQSDAFVRGLGYNFYDLAYGRESRVALPYPQRIDQRDEQDPIMRIFGQTTGGQIAYGDALYLRDVVGTKSALSLTKILKLACLFEIFEQRDSAAEIILANKENIDQVYDHRKLLDALVPVVVGEKLPYDEYIRRYFAHDPIFRPGAILSLPPIADPPPIVSLRTYSRFPKLRGKLAVWKYRAKLLREDPRLYWAKLMKLVPRLIGITKLNCLFFF
jgi:FkbM family methyltransferase